jgi:hypothetical protein
MAARSAVGPASLCDAAPSAARPSLPDQKRALASPPANLGSHAR